MSEICTVLGWDAAWTPHGGGAWCVLRTSSRRARKQLMLWESTPRNEADTQCRLQEILETYAPELIAIDMPIGKKRIAGYREADRATTRAFSRYGCPVHSPTEERPGQWGEVCCHEMSVKGYEVCTDAAALKNGVVEVYPHTALLNLLRLGYRFPYKVTRHRQLWAECSSEASKRQCRDHLESIFRRLDGEIELPRWTSVCPSLKPLANLKNFEDKVDALVCAWAGYQICNGIFVPYGDEDAAIWNPALKNLDPPNRTA